MEHAGQSGVEQLGEGESVALANAETPPLPIVQIAHLDDLPDAQINPRTHSTEQIEQLAEAMLEWGWTVPIMQDFDVRETVAGHGRKAAARLIYERGGVIHMAPGPKQGGVQLPQWHVPYLDVTGWTPDQRRAMVIADNALAEQAGWNAKLLGTELMKLDGAGFNMDVLGLGERKMVAFMASTRDDDEPPAPPPPVDRTPISRPGDVWTLGNHRLICGDCTDRAVVAKVLDGRKAEVCLTDPPYGIDKTAESGKNDYEGFEDSEAALIDLASKWLPIAREFASAVVFSPGVLNLWFYPRADWIISWFYGGGQLRSPWGFNCHQPFLCYGPDPSLTQGHGARPDAVDMNTPANAADIDHPCPKPLKLWEWLIARLCFKRGTVIFDPFMGSGTTIVAAERMGHSARGVERSPYYCDVAIRRWQAITGQKAKRHDGKLFDKLQG